MMQGIYDVVIIGAGSAGSFAAHELAKRKVNGKLLNFCCHHCAKAYNVK